MSKLVSATPPLPNPPPGENWPKQLYTALTAYLSDMARRVNGAFQKDGSEPMEGAIDFGGYGIAFPTTAVPSANPNVLDDYREGTTTPTITTATGAYGSVTGVSLNYVKIGKQVSWNATFTVGSLGSATGSAFIPMPFPVGQPAGCAGFNTSATSGVVGVVDTVNSRATIKTVANAVPPVGTITVGGTYVATT